MSLKEVEIEDLTSLLDVQKDFPVPPYIPDHRIWYLGSLGLFALSSFNQDLYEPLRPVYNPFKHVWQLLAPFKVQGFTWEIA